MLDKNGYEILTGDIVEIKNAYFKSDNGLYFVRHSAGDPDWLGSDHSLKKISKNGKIRKSKNSTGFWPIMVTVNDREKRAAAKEWNRKNATIEIVTGINTSDIAKYFLEQSEYAKSRIEFFQYQRGENNEVTQLNIRIKKHYDLLANRLS